VSFRILRPEVEQWIVYRPPFRESPANCWVISVTGGRQKPRLQGRIGRDVAQQVENGQRTCGSVQGLILAEAEGRVERVRRAAGKCPCATHKPSFGSA
jgi:hypothetical protein